MCPYGSLYIVLVFLFVSGASASVLPAPAAFNTNVDTIHSCDAFYHVQIPSDTTVNPNDDVAECFWLNTEDINPDLFGLTSIRTAVTRFIKQK